jgi:hypothetical protein
MYCLIAFFWGFLGGASIEILRIYKISVKGEGTFYYSKVAFVAALLMAFIGGALATAFCYTTPLTPLLAWWIGASAPAIIEKFVSVSPM